MTKKSTKPTAPTTNEQARGPIRYHRVSRVAEILDISRGSVYDLIKDGKLVGVVRIGSRLRIPQDAVDALLKSALVG